jgi:proteasome lid subunit RPN8/RPN11
MDEVPMTPDVRRLREQDLPTLDFPAPRRQEFRVYFTPNAHQQITRHAAEDVTVEVCGVLVGRWGKDGDGPFVEISEMIRSDSADSRSEQVTFTHEAWAEISKEMDTRFADRTIVGWYHSHPGFGVFLSERDCFIHEHFFANDGQVAYVVDPVRETEGVFVWEEGKPTASSRYWVGDRIYSKHTTVEEERSRPGSATPSGDDGSAPADQPGPLLPGLSRVLMYVAVFVIGYLLASLPNSWRQRRMIEGTVAYYGIWKGLRPGLKEHLDAVASNLDKVSAALTRVEDQRRDRTEDSAETEQAEWQEIRRQLHLTQRLLASIQARYCLDAVEAAVVAEIVAQKLAELEGQQARPEGEKPDDRPAEREKQKSATPPAGEKQAGESEVPVQSGGKSRPEPSRGPGSEGPAASEEGPGAAGSS